MFVFTKQELKLLKKFDYSQADPQVRSRMTYEEIRDVKVLLLCERYGYSGSGAFDWNNRFHKDGTILSLYGIHEGVWDLYSGQYEDDKGDSQFIEPRIATGKIENLEAFLKGRK